TVECVGAGLHSRASSYDGELGNQGEGINVFDRYCSPESEASSRSGREVSSPSGENTIRYNSGRVFKRARVESIAILKLGSKEFAEYGGGEGAEVFDIKVDQHQSFTLASGPVVHNCDIKPGTVDLTILPALTWRNGWLWRIGVPKRFGIGAKEFR